MRDRAVVSPPGSYPRRSKVQILLSLPFLTIEEEYAKLILERWPSGLWRKFAKLECVKAPRVRIPSSLPILIEVHICQINLKSLLK